MSQLGLEPFDHSLQKSSEWIHELMQELGWEDAPRTVGALRAVLHTVRDGLPVAEAASLAAGMPTVVRGLYSEGWRPLEQLPVLRHRGDTLRRIEEQLGGSCGVHGEEPATHVVRSVLRVLDRHVAEGEVESVRHALPADLRVLWPGGGSSGTDQ